MEKGKGNLSRLGIQLRSEVSKGKKGTSSAKKGESVAKTGIANVFFIQYFPFCISQTDRTKWCGPVEGRTLAEFIPGIRLDLSEEFRDTRCKDDKRNWSSRNDTSLRGWAHFQQEHSHYALTEGNPMGHTGISSQGWIEISLYL